MLSTGGHPQPPEPQCPRDTASSKAQEEARSDSSPNCINNFISYLKTRKGTILAIEIGLCIILIICYRSSVSAGGIYIAIIKMVFCILIFIVFMLQLESKMAFINWPGTDFLRAAIGSLSFLVMSLINVSYKQDAAGTAGVVFGLLTSVLYACDAYTTLQSIRQSKSQAGTEPQLLIG